MNDDGANDDEVMSEEEEEVDEVEVEEDEETLFGGATSSRHGGGDEEQEEERTQDVIDASVEHASPAAALDAFFKATNWNMAASFATLSELDCIRLVNHVRGAIMRGEHPATREPIVPPGAAPRFETPVVDARRMWQRDDDENDELLVAAVPGDPLLLYAISLACGEDDDGDDDVRTASHSSHQLTSTETETAAAAAAAAGGRGGGAAATTGSDGNFQLKMRPFGKVVPEKEDHDLFQRAAYAAPLVAALTGTPSSGAGAAASTSSSSSLVAASAQNANEESDTEETEGKGKRRHKHRRRRQHQKRHGTHVSGRHDDEDDVSSDSYFASYARFSIHREMLSDKPRTEAYRRAIEHNTELIRGARVLDVGCGTGILSLFALRAGAAHVVAIDGSKRMAELAHAVAGANGFASRLAAVHDGTKLCHLGDADTNALTVLSGRVEALKLHGEGDNDGTDTDNAAAAAKVDVIVSEWMGYALLFEAMFDSVIDARDRLLKPGGAVLPDRAALYVAGGGAGSSSLPFWKDVYGFDFTAIGDQVLEESVRVGVVTSVQNADIVTSTAQVHAYDLMTLRKEDVGFVSEFCLERNTCQTPHGDKADEDVHTLVLWFDVDFSERFCTNEPVTLSTSPAAETTHWAQTVLHLRTPISADADILRGALAISRSTDDERGIDICVQVRGCTRAGEACRRGGSEQTLIYQI